MKSYQIYIVKNYNNGKKIPEEIIAKIIDPVIEKFGKSTLQEEAKMPLVQGMWTSDEGKRYSDKVYLYYLIINDTQENHKWFTAQAEIWRKLLDQDAFLIVVQYAETIIAKRPKKV